MPPCLGCGRTTKGGSRCARCKGDPHVSPRAWRDSPVERARCLAVKERWIAEHGLVCAGWAEGGHAPHPVRSADQLSIDHEPAVSTVQDPTYWNGDRVVRCISINSSKGISR